MLMVPAFAQTVTTSEDKTTRTVVEETITPDGKVVTTTVYEKDAVFTGGFWRNWTLSGNLGAQLFYGDNDWKVAKFTEMITFPAIDVYLTKWASPSFGVGIGASYGVFKGLYQSHEYQHLNWIVMNQRFVTSPIEYYNDADPKYNSQQLAYQRGSWINAYVLAHADLGNIFFGYNPNRVFDVIAFGGGGLIFGLNDRDAQGTTWNLGLSNQLRLADRLKLNLNLRGAFVADSFDGEDYIQEPNDKLLRDNHKSDGLFGATLGLTFDLDGEGWRTANRSSVYEFKKETVEKIVKETVTVVEPQVVQDIPEVWFHINFVVDKWDISKRELINLHSIADLIKSTPNTKYLVCGYADKQTATPDHNMMLSEKRSEAVYDALVNQFGVPASQIVRDYKGGVDYMFYNEKELSRCVMINSIKE
jgi:outer membrane protein OmpA-like peptidoglycan-associated protein